MATPFNMTRDVNGYNGFGLPFALDQYSCTLTMSTDTTLTVPSSGMLGNLANNVNKYIAIFSFEPGAKVWIAINTAAEVPAGNTFAATSSQLNPSARYVQDGDVLHFITADTTADVGVAFYAVQ